MHRFFSTLDMIEAYKDLDERKKNYHMSAHSMSSYRSAGEI